MDTPEEVPLTGGRLTQGVVRVGNTVRRPTGPHTPFVHSLLRHLEEVGFDRAPRALGIDQQARVIVTSSRVTSRRTSLRGRTGTSCGQRR
jgi:hypothetical protein